MSTQEGGQYISKEQKKHQKALEQARQLGHIPAEKDEEGKDINPHMPKFITKAPWYVDTNKPSLQHQKWFQAAEKSSLNEWYARGQRGFQATKYRKGACENCGAMTHKTKDCCERPRKRGAKQTGEDIKADEIIVDLDLDYDGKRDRYNGYNPDNYSQVIAEHELFEQERKKKKNEQQKDGDEEGEEDLDYKQSALEEQQVGGVSNPDSKTKTASNMNLRIREDRAVYLENLDVNSAFFDPKSRAMRDNPNPHLPEDQQTFKGLNYIRATGETAKILQQEVLVWDRIQNTGADLGSIANPSATESFFKKQKQEDIDRKNEQMKKLYDRYGGEFHVKTAQDLQQIYKEKASQEDDELERLESEKQKEINLKMKTAQAGKKENVMKLSKYPEDQFVLGHTSVWGSWWNETLGWGYQCCYETDKFSQCEGEKARKMAVIREYHAKKKMQEELQKYQSEVEKEQISEQQQQPAVQKQEQQQEKPQVKQVIDAENTNGNKDQGQLQEIKEESEQSESSSSSSNSDSDSSDSDSDSDSGSNSDSNSDSSDSESESSRNSSVSDQKRKNKKKKQDKKRSVSNENQKNKSKASKKLKEKEEKQKKKDKFVKLDNHKVQEAIQKEKDRLKRIQEEKNDKKRKYNSLREDYSHEPTAEEIEAYKIGKSHFDDPMAKYNDVD